MSPIPTVAVALPAYNEAEGIAEFVLELDHVLGRLSSGHTFVVVDDASTDPTTEVLEQVRGTLTGTLEVMSSTVNRGHGPTVVAAYRRCLELAPDLIVQVDGDGQFDAEDLELLFAEEAAGAAVVTGVRMNRADPGYRRVVTGGLRLLLRIVFGVRRRDANCPFRLYRGEVLSGLVDQLPADPRVPHVELTVLESRAAVTTAEVQVRHRPRRGDGVGTMWRGRTRLASIGRLARFCGAALVEVMRFARTHRTGPGTGPGGGPR